MKKAAQAALRDCTPTALQKDAKNMGKIHRQSFLLQAHLMKTLSSFFAAFIAALLITLTSTGCSATGESTKCKMGSSYVTVNADVSGLTYTAHVYVDGHLVVKHRFPPFVDSRDEKIADYDGHEVKSVLTTRKEFGNTNVQIFVYIDGERVANFYF